MARRDFTDRGVTLIELLVVLALIGVLMGIGVGMYTNLGRQGTFSASVTRVLSTVNRVRNSSVTHPAALQINAGDAAKGETSGVRGIEFVTMAQSQCEPLTAEDAEGSILPGAYGRDGRILGHAEFREGVIGKALFLTGGGVDFGKYAAYDATEGISISLWVHPLHTAGGALVHRGDGLGLYLVRRGEGLGIRFELAFASSGGAGAEGDDAGATVVVAPRTFEPKDTVLPVGRWSRIVATYDRSAVVISVDQGRGPVEKLRERETARLAPSTKDSLFVGGGGGQGSTFQGGIDDLRIEGVLGEDYQPLPPQMEVEGRSRRLYFLGGKLDPAHHTRAETMVLRMGKRERRIVIGTEGNILEK